MKHLMRLAVLALAACGADGPPEKPAPTTGVTISGTVSVGVVGGG